MKRRRFLKQTAFIGASLISCGGIGIPNIGNRKVPSNGDNVLTQYQSDIAAASGSLTAQDITNLTSFVNQIGSTIWNKLVDVGVFMGGFNGAFTKIKYPSTLKTLTNTGFVSGDYSETTGLVSSVGTKYLDTGIAPSSYGLNKNNFSCGVYMLNDNNSSNDYLLGDNPASGVSRIQMTKSRVHIYNDAGSGNMTRTINQQKTTDPHFIALSMGTNIILMENFQKTVLDGQYAVTGTSLTLDGNIRLCRGTNTGGTGGGAYGGYFISQTLTYAELRTIQLAFIELCKNKGRITPTKQLITFGDSITAGNGASSFTNRWSYKLAGLTGLQERNVGIGSSVFRVDTTVPGGYVRRSELLDYNVKNSKIVIQYGVNDYSYGTGVTSDFSSKMVTLCNELLAAGALDIQVGSPSIVNNGIPTATQQAFRDACSSAVSTVANSKVVFKDVWQYMTDNGGVGTLLGGDNLHPNDAGHLAIANAHNQ